MPISYGSYEKQLKLLPITMNYDGSASVTIKYGFVEAGTWVPYTENSILIRKNDVDSILDTAPQAGLTRRNDLSLAIYNYLVVNNLVEPGQIS